MYAAFNINVCELC